MKCNYHDKKKKQEGEKKMSEKITIQMIDIAVSIHEVKFYVYFSRHYPKSGIMRFVVNISMIKC